MSGEYETPNVYDDIEMEERQPEATYLEIVAGDYEEFNTQYDDTVVEETRYEVAPTKSKKRWLMIAVFSLLAAVCFGAGFAVAYFVLPSAGRLLGLL